VTRYGIHSCSGIKLLHEDVHAISDDKRLFTVFYLLIIELLINFRVM